MGAVATCKVIYEEGLPNIWGNAQIFSHIWGGLLSYMTLQLLPSGFPYIWGKFCFLFYQCSNLIASSVYSSVRALVSIVNSRWCLYLHVWEVGWNPTKKMMLCTVLWIRIRIREPVESASFSRIRIVIGDLQGLPIQTQCRIRIQIWIHFNQM